MTETFTTRSPVDQSPVVTRPYATHNDIKQAVALAQRAQRVWRATPVAERIHKVLAFVDAMLSHKEAIAKEITQQMGRPIRYAQGELRGFEERVRMMSSLAEEALQDVEVDPKGKNKPQFRRFLRRDPIGVVLVIAPWNYPFLTAVNSIVPAILAGNAVLLKHSRQTPLVAERFTEAFSAAGLPNGVFQHLHMSGQDALWTIREEPIDFVSFTGSVPSGQQVQEAAAARMIGSALELGGKDPAYVRADADIPSAVEDLVDGAMFNSGQCCCGIERIYVHEDVYDDFVEKFVALTKEYKVGDPMDPETTLGPVINESAAKDILSHIDEAVTKGATLLVGQKDFDIKMPSKTFVAPHVLVNVDHTMLVINEETFGPVIGIMKVSSDEQAIAHMNDSKYGLTASIWTADAAKAEEIGGALETGTVYMNRCDYLDPELVWTGVKNSGRGFALSKFGFDQFTRWKSFHLKLSTGA